jgi:hypothetical protein
MPHNPYWMRELPAIERTLEAIAEPILDRRAIERLFHVSQAEAGRILRRVGAVRAGNANIVFRRQVLAWIRKVARSDAFEYEYRRVERIGLNLADAKQTIVARSVELPAPRAIAAGFAPNIELTAGRLTVTFTTAPELLGALNEIVLAATRDWLQFQATCEN